MRDVSDHFLTFRLDGDLYALPVRQVSEVLEYTHITRLPGSDASMKGIINLREKGIPVFDLRSRFGFGEIEVDKDTAIVVVELELTEQTLIRIGALVDGVEEVVEIGGEEIEDAPRMGTRLSSSHIAGIARRGDRFIVLVDLESIFAGTEEGLLELEEEGRLAV